MAAKKKTAPARRAKPAKPTRGRGFPALRLLPVTILVVSLTLFVRVNDIWRGVAGLDVAAFSFNQSEAQQPPPPGGRKRGQPSPDTPATTAPAAPAAGAVPNAASPAAAPGAPPAVPAATSGEGEQPTFTQTEVDVLQKLAERREVLDARQQDLDLRENMVKAAESRIDKKIAEMKALQENIQAMLKQVDDQDDSKMGRLVKIYENMKPKDAAKIFEQLDLPVLLGVMARMKEQKVAPIMEAMDPMKAKTITDSMAVRRAAKTEGQTGG
jgi:flagellar motility protein MotE (MotC chaperone)